MLLTITYTKSPADDLGYLLHKNPSRPQTFELSFGNAHVFYPEVSDEICTVALLLDINPLDLSRRKKGAAKAWQLFDYVNDRPYVTSSFLSVAISRIFSSAMKGKSKDRAELVEENLPLEVQITMIPCKGGEDVIRRLFEPLGYEVFVEGYMLDEKFTEWGKSNFYSVTLKAKCKLKDLLNHIYVLIPVLDKEKHYWVGDDEVEKLISHGERWLATHPEKGFITKRYLRWKRGLVDKALSRLIDEGSEDIENESVEESSEESIEKVMNLNEQRLETVISILKNIGAKKVIDLGCGEGKLLAKLLKEKCFDEIAGMDVSYRALERAKERLKLDWLPGHDRDRIELFQGSLTYRDKRIGGYEAATILEIIEHLDENRLDSLKRVVFEFARPKTVIITTPNIEYNVKYDGLDGKRFRHTDHRFEWTRAEFKAWATETAETFGYSVNFLNIGEEDQSLGAPTQMGVFTL